MQRALSLALALAFVAAALADNDPDAGWRITAQSKEEAVLQSRIIGMVVSSAGTSVASQGVLNRWFTNFRSTFGRNYSSPQAEQNAMKNFQANLMKIQQMNADPSTPYWLAPNKFSDMSEQQFQDTVLMKPWVTGGLPGPSPQRRLLAEQSYANPVPEMPAGIAAGRKLMAVRQKDWRVATATQVAAVTPVKDQGWCGSCVFFASAAAYESAYHIANKISALTTPKDFSEQQGLRCALYKDGYQAWGCDGAQPDSVMTYIGRQGLAADAQYPYNPMYLDWNSKYYGTNPVEACATTKAAPYGKYAKTSWAMAQTATYVNETELMRRVDIQPQVILFNVTDAWQNYAGGIFTQTFTQCRPETNHAMLLVGYYQDTVYPSKSYWIIKNSWTPYWGEKGFARVAFSGENTFGVCGLYTSVTAPPLSFSVKLV